MTPTAGLGFRMLHLAEALLAERQGLWFEVHAENYMMEGGPRLAALDRLRERHPISLHGVGLSIASTDPIDPDHLARLARLVARIEPFLVSDHLAWQRWDGVHHADFLPFPRTADALHVVAGNVARVQDVLKRRILVENPSHYAALPGHEMTRYMAAFRYGGEPTFEPGLTVHRNTARLAARDALGANHPVTRRVIGAPMFEQIAQIYLDWRPLSDPRLHLYGEGLDRLIAEVPALDGLPFLPHLVRLERLWLDSLFAADAPVLSADALPPLDAETRLSPHPATRIEAFPYPVVSLWAAHQGEDPERSLQAMEWGPETALISRTSGASHITTVDPAAVPFLAACNKGESLLSAAATIGPDKAMPVFSRLLVLGAFRAPDPHPHNKEFA